MEKTSIITLPKWLDDLIFNEMGANYCRQNANMTNIDDDKDRALNYLGTYFPRSYAEAYTIFGGFFQKYKDNYNGKTELKIFDFGCGTGGEIIGLLTAIEEYLPEVQTVEVAVFDGNNNALRLYERILETYKRKSNLKIQKRIFPIVIDDFYDLSILNSVVTGKFDLIITFKAICEFVTKNQFENINPYGHIAKIFLPKLVSNGFMVLVDITIYDGTSDEWLPIKMDNGLNEADCNIVSRNSDYNQKIYITHSQAVNDVTKIAWRIIKNV